MPFKRRHSQRCADADILASTFAEITSVSAAVQRQSSTYSCYPVLSVAMSAMYSVLSWTKNTSVQKEWEMLRVIQIRPTKRLVDSKIKTEYQRSLSKLTTRSWQPQKDSSVSGRLCPQLHVRLRPQTCKKLADMSAVFTSVHLWSSITPYGPYICNTTQRKPPLMHD